MIYDGIKKMCSVVDHFKAVCELLVSGRSFPEKGFMIGHRYVHEEMVKSAIAFQSRGIEGVHRISRDILFWNTLSGGEIPRQGRRLGPIDLGVEASEKKQTGY